MREIRFRGKATKKFQIQTEHGAFLRSIEYGQFATTNDFIGAENSVLNVGADRIVKFFEHVGVGLIDQSTVGQWTGLKDKNGVDIYEGDIVGYNIGCSDSDNPSGIIEFQIGQYFIEHDGNLLTIDDTTDIEVIGNIHEVTK